MKNQRKVFLGGNAAKFDKVYPDIYELLGRKSFHEMLIIFKESIDKVYYFTIDDAKVPFFLKCTSKNPDISNISDSTYIDKVRIKFTWETLLSFGTDVQQEELNVFRRRYINYLLDGVCVGQCKYITIGTPALSAKSDMDFDMSGVQIENVIKKVFEVHSQYFDDSLDLLFDVNLYGSVFNFDQYSKTKLSSEFSERQKLWSFVRIVETLIFLDEATQKRYIFELNNKHKQLYEAALYAIKTGFKIEVRKKNTTNVSKNVTNNAKLMVRTKSLDKYAVHLGEYFSKKNVSNISRSTNNTNNSNVKTSKFFDVVESFSLAKFYERETYRSLGAVLHIVHKRETLVEKDFYLHSVYDNFGFVLENLLHHKLCGNIFKNNILKIAKYLFRICDGLILYDSRYLENSFVVKLKDLSNNINIARRNTDDQKTVQAYNDFMTFINIQLNNSNDISNIYLGLYLYKELIFPLEN